jgi:hypothetical protein
VKLRAGLGLKDTEGGRAPLPTKIWTLCIRTIEESIQRYSTGSGSKGYQEYIKGFLPERSTDD